MSYLIDTDWLINAMADRGAALDVLEALSDRGLAISIISLGDLAISIISLGELYAGVVGRPHQVAEIGFIHCFPRKYTLVTLTESTMLTFARLGSGSV